MQPLKQNFNMTKTCQKPYAKTPQKLAKNPLKIPQPKIFFKHKQKLYETRNKNFYRSHK